MEPTPIPKDFEDYEEKIMFGLGFRQLFWGGIALGGGAAFYCLTTLVLRLNEDIAIFGTIGLAYIVFLLGWGKWQHKRPYTEKVKAMYAFYSTKQIITYFNDISWKGDKDVQKNKEDKKINREYVYERKPSKRK